METGDFDYHLPSRLIAQTPLEQRDRSRLLFLERDTGRWVHGEFSQLMDYVRPGDCLVFNDTRVFPARLLGWREAAGARVELLLLRQLGRSIWETLARPGRRARIGDRLSFGDGRLKARILGTGGAGERIVEFMGDEVEAYGRVPLPPYIRGELAEPERYQTVYARRSGSAAAPTAGLHFTAEILDRLRANGVTCTWLTLHVGLGTFRPVREMRVEDHRMHEEFYHLAPRSADEINRCRWQGGRIIAVGTTVARSLETLGRDDGTVVPGHGWTDLFIYPGYRFRVLDGLLTNFHLPKSTLLILVCAFGGYELVLSAYREAVAREYRFFSFGDAMLIL